MGFEVWGMPFSCSPTDSFDKVLRVLKVLRFAECADNDKCQQARRFSASPTLSNFRSACPFWCFAPPFPQRGNQDAFRFSSSVSLPPLEGGASLLPLTAYLKLAMLYELCIAPSLLIPNCFPSHWLPATGYFFR